MSQITRSIQYLNIYFVPEADTRKLSFWKVILLNIRYNYLLCIYSLTKKLMGFHFPARTLYELP
jgi:hypothetical protein